MKKLYVLVFLVLMFRVGLAQQTPYMSNYLSNRFVDNPAYAGVSDNACASLFVKSYFIGFAEKNPGTQFMSYTSKVSDYGIGLALMNDYFGSMRNTSFRFAYAYHLKLNDDYSLSMALAPKIAQFSMNQSEYVYFDMSDDAISGISESKLYFDADFGVALYSDQLIAGLGVKQLFQPNLSLGGNTSKENKLYREIFLHADYQFELSEDFMIQPFARFAYSEADLFYEIGSRFQLKDLVWIGATYKSYPALSVMFGVDYKMIQFGYAYDYNLQFVSGYSSGTHEIVLNYCFGSFSESLPKF